MIDVGLIMDSVLALALGAVPGSSGERGLRLAKDVPREAFPHVFVHTPDLAQEELAWGQVAETLVVQVAVVTRNETQEQTLAAGELVRDALVTASAPALSVETGFVQTFALEEDPNDPFCTGFRQ